MVTFNAEIIDDYSINAKLCKSSNKKIGLDFLKSGSNSILRYLAIRKSNIPEFSYEDINNLKIDHLSSLENELNKFLEYNNFVHKIGFKNG